MNEKVIITDLEDAHEHVIKELVSAVPQLEGDPTLITCKCGPKQVCKICPPSKKIKFLEHRDHQVMQRTGLGPIRSFTESHPDPHSHVSKRLMARRMDELRLVAQKKIGRKLSRKEFKEITEKQAREIYEKQLEAERNERDKKIAVPCAPDGTMSNTEEGD